MASSGAMTVTGTTPLDPSELPTLFPDLTPIPQDDGPHPVCAIDYSDDFVRAYDYLRAALRSNEFTERSLRLTGLCLQLNPANYTVWHYRRRILSALSSSAKGEERGAEQCGGGIFDPSLVALDLALAAKLGGGNPKNYQIWYHRRALLEPVFEQAGAKDDEEVMRAAREELMYVGTVLQEDAKNYHAWSHRQWINRTLNSLALWSEENEYTHSLISDDLRNNSAWNQRWFVTHLGSHAPLSADDARSECQYALRAAAADPHNESPWRYLIGIVREQEKTGGPGAAFGLIELCLAEVVSLKAHFEENAEAGGKPAACPNMLAAYVDLLESKGGKEYLEEAKDIVHSLATDCDTIRRKYWMLKGRQIQSLLEKLP